MMLFMVIFWAAVIFLAFYLFKRYAQQPGGAPPPDTPLEIAKRRYAKGEIPREEFEQIKHDLQS
ncbi:MAG: SHOCT domain-containing protein [Candidatus Latescibacterota bacterium]